MFEGSKLKVKLATGREFHTEPKCLLLITFAPGLEYIINCYVVDKLITPSYIRYAVALELQSVGGLAKLCFDFAKQ